MCSLDWFPISPPVEPAFSFHIQPDVYGTQYQFKNTEDDFEQKESCNATNSKEAEQDSEVQTKSTLRFSIENILYGSTTKG